MQFRSLLPLLLSISGLLAMEADARLPRAQGLLEREQALREYRQLFLDELSGLLDAGQQSVAMRFAREMDRETRLPADGLRLMAHGERLVEETNMRSVQASVAEAVEVRLEPDRREPKSLQDRIELWTELSTLLQKQLTKDTKDLKRVEELLERASDSRRDMDAEPSETRKALLKGHVAACMAAVNLALGLPAEADPGPRHAELKTAVSKLQRRIIRLLQDILSAKRALAENEALLARKEQFIREHPHFFLKKKYCVEDVYGMVGVREAEGREQVVTIMDSFHYAIPDPLAASCTNAGHAESLVKLKGEEGSDHGIQVASILLQAAPQVRFEAQDSLELMQPIRLAARPDDYNLRPAGPRLCLADVERIRALVLARQDIRVRSGNAVHVIDVSALPHPGGRIVNLSLSLGETLDTFRGRAGKIQYQVCAVAAYIAMLEAGKLLVFAAGNESAVLGSHAEAYAGLRTLAELYPRRFLVAMALKPDGVTLTRFGNQPGAGPLATMCVCAPGHKLAVVGRGGLAETVSGTSFAAPFVSAVAAILLSLRPEASAADVCAAILASAVPIVQRPTLKRLQDVPMALLRVTADDLRAGGTYRTLVARRDAAGFREKGVEVTEAMLAMAMAKYGRGRIHLRRALQHLTGQIIATLKREAAEAESRRIEADTDECLTAIQLRSEMELERERLLLELKLDLMTSSSRELAGLAARHDPAPLRARLARRTERILTAQSLLAEAESELDARLISRAVPRGHVDEKLEARVRLVKLARAILLERRADRDECLRSLEAEQENLEAGPALIRTKYARALARVRSALDSLKL